jgi:hypothetical protein
MQIADLIGRVSLVSRGHVIRNLGSLYLEYPQQRDLLQEYTRQPTHQNVRSQSFHGRSLAAEAMHSIRRVSEG